MCSMKHKVLALYQDDPKLCFYDDLDLSSFRNLDHEVIFGHAGDLPVFQAF